MDRRLQILVDRLLIPAPKTGADDRLRKGETTIRVLVLAVLSGLVVETLIMTILYNVEDHAHPLFAVLDIVLTAVLVFPTLFLFLVRPLAYNILERKRAQEELQKSRAFYQAVVEDQIEYICRFSPSWQLTFANRSFSNFFKVRTGTSLTENFPASDYPDFAEIKSTLLALTPENPVAYSHLQKLKSASGDMWVSWTFRALFDNSGEVIEYQASGHDITERLIITNELRKAYEESQVRVSERTAELAEVLKQIRLLSTAVASTASGVLITDIEGKVIWANPAVAQMTGYSSSELLGQNVKILRSGQHEESFYAELWDAILSGKTWRTEMVNRRKDGSLYMEEQTITPLMDEDGQVTHFVAVKLDTSERRKADMEIRQRNLELQVLNKISAACSSTLEESVISDTLAQILSKEVDVPGGVIYTYDEEGRMLCPVSSWGMPEGEPAFDKCIPANEFHCPRAMNQKEVVVETDFREIQGFQYESLGSEHPHWKGYLCVPLVAHDRLYGLVDLFKNGSQGILAGYEDAPGGFTAREARFYQALGNQVGMAFQNAELYRKEQQARQLAEGLQSASLALSQSLELDEVFTLLLDYLEKLIPIDSAWVALLEDPETLVVRASSGYEGTGLGDNSSVIRLKSGVYPMVDQVITGGKSILIPDTHEHPEWAWLPENDTIRCWLGVPLIADGKVIGLYSLELCEANCFTPEHVIIAEAMISQAATAVQNAWLFSQLRANHASLQSLSRRLVDIQETERSYIARELHDEAGQALASLLLGLDLLARRSGNQTDVISGIKELEEIVEQVIDGLHRMAVSLRPVSLDHLGLVAALRQYVETISDRHDLAIQFETVGIQERMLSEMETSIYRIVQEATANVILHAQATRLDILLERRGNRVVVLIEDNGVGFEPSQAFATGRLGLLGMRERAEMLGGNLMVESAPGKGATIICELPLEVSLNHEQNLSLSSTGVL